MTLCVDYFSPIKLIGKNVFKKSVKLTISVVPTQTNQNSATPMGSASDTVGGGANDTGEVITFDGKTFTVTFSQNSGTV